jgi:hypothetical protein
MTRFTGMAVLAGSLVAMGLMVGAAPATAQKESCGPAAYSNEQQRYVGLPCAPKADSASPCGPAAYSNADQNYSSLPCTAPTPKAEQGKPQPCGPVAYSVADQTYVGVPCTH